MKFKQSIGCSILPAVHFAIGASFEHRVGAPGRRLADNASESATGIHVNRRLPRYFKGPHPGLADG